MNSNKMGKFIRDLRIENKMNQEDLSEKIIIDRTVISKWESGKLIPDTRNLIALSEIFNVSLDELVSGERTNNKNENQLHKNFLDYLINENTKYRRLKLSTFILSLTVIIIAVIFLIYYFSSTYNTNKVYKVIGESENYQIAEGILVTSREDTYLKIGYIKDKNNLNSLVDNITIYYKEYNENNIIYTGDPNKIIIDFSGYNSAINIKSIKDIEDNLYVRINSEDIKLKFYEYFKNNSLIFDDKDDFISEQENLNNYNIPKRIKDEFTFLSNMYYLKLNDEIELSYYPISDVYYVSNLLSDITIEYYISSTHINFRKNDEYYFYIDSNKNISCYKEDCSNEIKIYNEYFDTYIKPYIR